ncbi:hypothetical protein GSI_15569 [Ganoderma sinense ZZ0214-1]|uniref:Uncharacterized protein n=1 Tax=Ganoderma sinense ZZ0214-1 TaxID=1077348 RepID=A0A2G8RMZ1_9APHY|nr:hypothetical protein GSI_15569 [Ganoderma sinense ZZ0214-1]
MAGKPFKVGRFAHTLRVRLMREHLGVDVDALYEEDLMAAEPLKEPHEQEPWDPDREQQSGKDSDVTRITTDHQTSASRALVRDIIDSLQQGAHGYAGAGAKKASLTLLHKAGIPTEADGTDGQKSVVQEREMYTRSGEKDYGFPSSVVPTLEEKTVAERMAEDKFPDHPTPIAEVSEDTESSSTPNSNGYFPSGDASLRGGGPSSAKQLNGSAKADGGVQDGSTPPSGSSTANDHGDVVQNGSVQKSPPQAATETGELYGAPANAAIDPQHDNLPPRARSGKNDGDSEEEKASARATIRKHLSSKLGNKQWQLLTPTPHVDPHGFEDPICDAFWKGVWVACAVHNTEIFRKVFHAIPDDLVTTWKQYKEFIAHHERLNKPLKDHDPSEPSVARVPSEAPDYDASTQHRLGEQATRTSRDELARSREFLVSDGDSHTLCTQPTESPPPVPGQNHSQNQKEKEKERRPAKGPKPFDQAEREEMENVLRELRGHLVIYPTRFLEGEDKANNFLFASDRLLPLPIYD